MKKLIFIVFLFIGVSTFAQPFTTISNGESGLSVRTNLNNLITWTNALGLDIEFSVDNATWHYPWASGDLYIRYSGDYGVSWSDGIYLVASDSFFVQTQDSLIAYVTPTQLMDSVNQYSFVQPIDSIMWSKYVGLTHEEGKEYYDSVTQSKTFYSKFSDIALQIGEELWTPLVRNVSGGTISDKTPVVIMGSDNGLAAIDSASNLTYDESRLIGLATHDIANNDSGRVTIYGDVGGDWSALSTGIVYLGENGTLTNTRPTGGKWVIIVGYLHDNSSDGKLFVNPMIAEHTAEVDNINGFAASERTGTTLSFNAANRYTKISPVGDEFYYYIDGVKYIKTGADSVQISDVTGLHVTYYDSTSLTTVANPTDGQVDAVIRTKAIVKYDYWNATDDSVYYEGDERHGIEMSPTTHAYLHFTGGGQYLNGLSLSDMKVDGNGDVDSTAQFGVNSGFIADEDLVHMMPSYPRGSTIPIYYKTGANGDWGRVFEDGFAVTNTGSVSGTLYYNEWTGTVWQLTETNNNDFILCHIFATNDLNYGTIAIMGEEEYATQGLARAGANTEILDLQIKGLPAEEFVPVASVIFQTSTGYSNDVQARIRSTDTGDDYVDWRFVDPTGAIGTATTATAWADLSDTDNSYTGKGGWFSLVNGAASGMELTNPTAIELTGFDSTGFRLTIPQVEDLQDTISAHRTDIDINLGKDTTGIYHTNRPLLDDITAADTTRWGAGSDIKAGNGLTLRNDSVLLGGELTESTMIDAGAYDFSIFSSSTGQDGFLIGSGSAGLISSNSGFSEYSLLQMNRDDINIESTDDIKVRAGDLLWLIGNDNVEIEAPREVLLQVTGGSAVNNVLFFGDLSTGWTLKDAENEIGAHYFSDYSTNGLSIDRWIPDIAATRSEISDSIATITGSSPLTAGEGGYYYSRGTRKGNFAVGSATELETTIYASRDSTGHAIRAYNEDGDGLKVGVFPASNVGIESNGIIEFTTLGASSTTTSDYTVGIDTDGTLKRIANGGGGGLWQDLTGAIAPNPITDVVRMGTVSSSAFTPELFVENTTASGAAYAVHFESNTSSSGSAVRIDATATGISAAITGTAGKALNVDASGTSAITIQSTASAASGTVYAGLFQATNSSSGIGIVSSGGLWDFHGASSGVIGTKEASTFATPSSGNAIWYAKSDGLPYFKNDAGTEYSLIKAYSVNSGAPSSSGDTGTAGEIRYDADYIYVCTATDTWKRVAISTW